jgi:hypothetical protein
MPVVALSKGLALIGWTGYLRTTVSGNRRPAGFRDAVRRRAEAGEGKDSLVLRDPVLGQFDFRASRRCVLLSELRSPRALRRFAVKGITIEGTKGG